MTISGPVRRFGSPLRASSGFTLIEVLIAILVMGFGLLGFAMLQTMSLRFSQSANQRTQATNLAYDLLDQMRANRLTAAQYEAASFEDGAGGACSRPIGGLATVAANITRWQCQVVGALGADASAVVVYNAGVVAVTLSWGDEQRWNADADATSFVVSTRL